MKKKVKTCSMCKKEYLQNESIRIYGSIPDLNHCCSSSCYTKKLMNKTNLPA